MANTADAGASRRARLRAQTTEEIKALARKQLAEGGTGALSLRGISREMGMAPAALFRYFDAQSALITALCVDAYDALAEAMINGYKLPAEDPTAKMRAAASAVRQWARANTGDFALISGTPIPGYRAQSSETGPAATKVVMVFGAAYAAAVAAEQASPARTAIRPTDPGPLLIAMLGPGSASSLDPALTGIVLTAWASIIGFLVGEIFGSLGELVADPGALFEDHLSTIMRGMGFTTV